jgi:hypothetical protein
LRYCGGYGKSGRSEKRDADVRRVSPVDIVAVVILGTLYREVSFSLNFFSALSVHGEDHLNEMLEGDFDYLYCLMLF